MAVTETKFVPPYGVPWDTFLNTLTRMETDGLPQRVDRSYLSNQSGNVQTYLMQALRSFDLIDEAGAPTGILKALVAAKDDDRKALVADLLRKHYQVILDLGSTTATQGQLEEKWTETYGQTGDTRRKAVRWFLSAAAYTGITLSKLWKAPRAATPGTARKARGAVKKTATTGQQQQTPPAPTDGDTYKVTLIGGGKVTLTVAESHFNLSKNRSDRDFVYSLVDAMTAYADSSGQEVAVGADDAEEPEVEP